MINRTLLALACFALLHGFQICLGVASLAAERTNANVVATKSQFAKNEQLAPIKFFHFEASCNLFTQLFFHNEIFGVFLISVMIDKASQISGALLPALIMVENEKIKGGMPTKIETPNGIINPDQWRKMPEMIGNMLGFPGVNIYYTVDTKSTDDFMGLYSALKSQYQANSAGTSTPQNFLVQKKGTKMLGIPLKFEPLAIKNFIECADPIVKQAQDSLHIMRVFQQSKKLCRSCILE